MIPFSHAILDDEGDIIRKHRWSNREARWFITNNPNVNVIVLPKVEQVKLDLFKLVGECRF